MGLGGRYSVAGGIFGEEDGAGTIAGTDRGDPLRKGAGSVKNGCDGDSDQCKSSINQLVSFKSAYSEKNIKLER